MKALLPLVLTSLAIATSSCGLANKVIQTPVRLMQAGVRTVSDVDDPTPPATAEASRTHGIALKVSQALPEAPK